MRFKRLYPGAKIWTLKLFGGKNTYPVIVEFNFWHFGKKVYHGPFYDARGKSILAVDLEDHWGWSPFPIFWGTSGILRCVTQPDIDVWRVWFYSRWGTICHIDLTINRRKLASGGIVKGVPK